MRKESLKFVCILLFIFIIAGVTLSDTKTTYIKNILFNDGNETKEESNYEVEQIRLFAITLEAQEEKIENVKSQPLTCAINVDRVTRLLYLDDGDVLGEKHVVYKSPVGKLMSPTKKGYTFEMWTNEDKKTIDENYVIDSTMDYKVYANWIIIVSNLTVDPNGGTWEESTGEASFSLDYLETKEIPDPTRTGYTFKNWELTGADSEIEDKVFTMGTEDSNLKAIWSADGYTLTIDPNGGIYENKSEKTEIPVDYDSVTDISTPTRKGYTFTGWTVSNGELNGNKFTMNYTGDVTLTANWQVNTYKYIVYHKQQSTDGSAFNIVSADTETGDKDYGTIITPQVKTYTGFTSPSAKSLTIDVDSNPPVKNIVNYDYNRNKFNLTIKPDSGTWNGTTNNSTTTLFYKQTYNVANPTRVGYNFKGWKTDVASSSITDLVFTMGLANTTLTATWEAKEYKLKYSVNGGNALSQTDKTISYDSTYGTLPTPTRTGYRFVGWYTSDSGGTQVTENTIHKVENNVTIYAHWSNTAPKISKYTITYANSGISGNGILKNGSETATLTVTSSDTEDGTPTVEVSCIAGKICNNKSLTITKKSNSTFELKTTAIGVALFQITATDLAGETAVENDTYVVYSAGNGLLVDAKYTNTTYDSGWLEYLEGCYISNFTFEVKFASGHNNSSSDPDRMIVTGINEKGQEIVLYTWSGNMQSTLHQSDLTVLNAQTEKIRQINFYTYSPHDDCAKTATIKYSVTYTFAEELLDSTYTPVG